MLRSNFTMKDTFTHDEAHFVLKQGINNILTMRLYNLDYLLLNHFDEMSEKMFFQPHEVLLGKSICDISLNDPVTVQKVLESRESDNYECPGSLINSLVQDDERRNMLIERKFYPKIMMVHFDFNMVSTVERAIKFKYFPSMNMILEKIFEHMNNYDYNPVIMSSLPCIAS